MANERKRLPSIMSKLADSVQGGMDRLYQSTYYSQPNSRKDLLNVQRDIDKSIDNVITNNMNNVGMPNISKLYSRIKDAQKGGSELSKSVEDMFSDQGLMDGLLSSYMDNKYLKELDDEIDTVCKYMPKLLEALDTRKDNVLSADHFNKDFINVNNENNVVNDSIFSKRIEEIKDKYNLTVLLDEVYDTTAKYGEQFIYVVPYKKAIAKLLDNKANTVTAHYTTESNIDMCEKNDEMVFMEGTFEDSSINILEGDKKANYHINIELERSNMVTSVVENLLKAHKKQSLINESSLSNAFRSEILNEAKKDLDETKGVKFKKEFNAGSYTDDLDFSAFDTTSTDGLYNLKTKENVTTTKVNAPGCLVKKLSRYNVIPVYIEDMCLGYYYLETQDLPDAPYNFENKLSSPISTMVSGASASSGSQAFQASSEQQREEMLRYMSGQLSQFIDSKFVNANQDLSKEIYMILKHNDLYNGAQTDRLKVTFIPPEDMIHVTFKKDPKTHRGISDLVNSLLPAKLYASLYITNLIAYLTRGQDKRIYYVKQQVETNIAKTLLNTIDQIKKSNMNIRQIENINNILNITGRFNDYVIPTNASGDYPINFEVMQGQSVDIKTDLMDMLEEMAINATEIPLELIQARQSMDYAVHYTMTNSKFLRKVFKRQAIYQKYCSDLITKIYNYEYDEDEDLKVMLPAPMFLNITNTNQIINNTNEFANSIVDIQMADEQDENVKSIFSKLVRKHYLNTYIDEHNIVELENQARQMAALNNDASEE